MYMARQRIKYIIKWIIIMLLASMLGLVIFDIVYITKSHDKFKPRNYETNITIQSSRELNKWEYKALITELFDTPHIYIEKNINDDCMSGKAHPLIRLVIIDNQLSNTTYAYTLAHELTHVKYQTGNEIWTSFKAFTILYESGSDDLKYIALRYAQEQLIGNFKGTEYDCSWYIAEYLGLLEE